jgi:hypothetical protein
MATRTSSVNDEQLKKDISTQLRKGFTPQWYINYDNFFHKNSDERVIVLERHTLPFMHYGKPWLGKHPPFQALIGQKDMEIVFHDTQIALAITGPGVAVLYGTLAQSPFNTVNRPTKYSISGIKEPGIRAESAIRGKDVKVAREQILRLADDIAYRPELYKLVRE